MSINRTITRVMCLCSLFLQHTYPIRTPPHPQQEGRLLARLRERIWAERFEGQSYTVDHPKLRRVVQEALRLQHELLASRYRLRDVRALGLGLCRCLDVFFVSMYDCVPPYLLITSTNAHPNPQNLATAAETNLRMMSRGLLHPPATSPRAASAPSASSPRHSPRSSPPRTPPSSSSRRRSALPASPDSKPQLPQQARGSIGGAAASAAGASDAVHHKWARVLASVYARTGIADLELFLQKLAHG